MVRISFTQENQNPATNGSPSESVPGAFGI